MSWQRLPGDSKSSALVGPPPLRAAAASALTAVPDRRRRLSQGVLLQASILARFLGLRLLRLDTVLVLLPADIPRQPSTAEERPIPVSAHARNALPRSTFIAEGLSEAARNIEESKQLLAKARDT